MLRSLFGRTNRLSRAIDTSAAAAGEIQITLTDYDAMERDLGNDQAARVQQLIGQRLKQELGRYDELKAASDGVFCIGVRDPEAVDLYKLGNHLVAAIEGEPVSLNRALIECCATAEVIDPALLPLAAVS
ncbi:MAG: hypothetical protein AAGG11_12830 [Pseudomonadota bacterium]